MKNLLASEEPEAKKFRFSPKAKIVIGITFFLLLFLILFGVLPGAKTLANAKKTYQQSQQLYQAFQSQDLKAIKENIQRTKESLVSTKKQFNRLGWVKFIPFLGGYYRDADHVLKASSFGLEAGEILVKAIEPYADILGFKSGKGFSGQTAEERVVFVVQTLEKISPQLDEISKKINNLRVEINSINPRRYPQQFRGLALREKIIDLQEKVDQLDQAVSSAKPALAILPQLLGEPEEKRYLLLFQNDAELRPTGGFMTAYAILKVHHGKITPLKSEDIYTLDARFHKRLPAPEPIKKYLPLVYYWHLRDMNLSPDFKVSMDNFTRYYQEEEIDGVIALDTKVPVELLKILGPVGVGGWGEFSANEDPRCHCPQVIYALELLADKPVGELRTGRKAVLGPLMHSILLNIMGSPRKMWPEFFNVMVNSLREKHLLLYFFDEKAQKAAEDFNAAGRIREYQGDYLHINDCNFAGAKSNMFIKEHVNQKIEIAADGTVTKTLTIDYKNPAPPSNCDLEKGELCLNGPYRNWFRIYVPRGSRLIEASGSEVEMKTTEDLGKTVFEGFFGDNGYQYRIELNNQIKEFELKTDEEIKLKV